MYYNSILPYVYPAKSEQKFCRKFDKNTGEIVTTLECINFSENKLPTPLVYIL